MPDRSVHHKGTGGQPRNQLVHSMLLRASVSLGTPAMPLGIRLSGPLGIRLSGLPQQNVEACW